METTPLFCVYRKLKSNSFFCLITLLLLIVCFQGHSQNILQGGNDALVQLRDTRAGTNWSYLQWEFSNGQRDWVLGRNPDGNFILYRENFGYTWTVNNLGNIGIGNNNPYFKLDVSGRVNANGMLLGDGGGSRLQGPGNLHFRATGSGDNHMSIFGNGNVAIGLNATNYKLQVGGETRTEKLFINVSGSYSQHPNEELHVTGDARIFEVDNQPASLGISAGWSKYFMESWGDRPNEISLKNDESTGDWQMMGPYSYDAVNDGHRLMFRYYTGDNSIDQFKTLAGEYLSVRDNGNVGIGIAQPSSKLHVYGDMTVSRLEADHANLNLDAGWSHLNMESWGDRPNEISLKNDESTGDWQMVGPYSYNTENDGHRLMFRYYTGDNSIGQNNTLAGEYLSVRDNGNVGIGIASPSTKLHVAGDMRLDGSVHNNDAIQFESQNGFHRIAFNQLRFYDWDSGGDNLTINDGRVGIGTAEPSQKLTVDGKINAEEIILENVDGADFVFEEDYDLRSLEETEQFIKANKHLPEIPSAAEMAEEGLEIKAMNILLLQKVEELTLHLIRMEKEAAARTEKMEKMHEELTALKAIQSNK